MKTTIYELLGLIKDGKAPKKIKFCGNIYEWEDDWYLTKEKNCKVCLGGKEEDYNILINAFNENVEIIEEPKKIEKWGEGALEEMEKCTDYTLEDLQKYIRILAETQNELIDEINNLKGND